MLSRAGVPRPIIAQADRGHGPPPVQTGIVLVRSGVSAVSVDGGSAIPTRTGSALPDHLRAAVVEIWGGRLENVPGFASSRSASHGSPPASRNTLCLTGRRAQDPMSRSNTR